MIRQAWKHPVIRAKGLGVTEEYLHNNWTTLSPANFDFELHKDRFSWMLRKGITKIWFLLPFRSMVEDWQDPKSWQVTQNSIDRLGKLAEAIVLWRSMGGKCVGITLAHTAYESGVYNAYTAVVTGDEDWRDMLIYIEEVLNALGDRVCKDTGIVWSFSVEAAGQMNGEDLRLWQYRWGHKVDEICGYETYKLFSGSRWSGLDDYEDWLPPVIPLTVEDSYEGVGYKYYGPFKRFAFRVADYEPFFDTHRMTDDDLVDVKGRAPKYVMSEQEFELLKFECGYDFSADPYNGPGIYVDEGDTYCVGFDFARKMKRHGKIRQLEKKYGVPAIWQEAGFAWSYSLWGDPGARNAWAFDTAKSLRKNGFSNRIFWFSAGRRTPSEIHFGIGATDTVNAFATRSQGMLNAIIKGMAGVPFSQVSNAVGIVKSPPEAASTVFGGEISFGSPNSTLTFTYTSHPELSLTGTDSVVVNLVGTVSWLRMKIYRHQDSPGTGWETPTTLSYGVTTTTISSPGNYKIEVNYNPTGHNQTDSSGGSIGFVITREVQSL